MRKQSILLLLFALLLANSRLFAQQDAEFTQYMYTNLTYNPAFAGTGDYINATLFNRQQWVGFGNGISTQNFNANMPIKTKNIGVGLNFVNEQVTITSALSGSGSFAYHIKMKGSLLSMGLNVGFKQNRLSGTVDARDAGDGVLTNSAINSLQPDIGFGMVYKSKIYYIGLSVLHLNNAKIQYTTQPSNSNLSRQYNFTAGYNYEINEKMLLTPTVLIRYAESSQLANNFTADFSLQWSYMEMFWLGTSYRTGDASALFAGINAGKINSEVFKELIKIGYAYDWSNSRIPSYNAGTHEIFISYDLPLKQKRQMPKFQ